MSAIPRAVREQIEALRSSWERSGANRERVEGALTVLGGVLAILDAADREHEDARRAHFERDDVP